MVFGPHPHPRRNPSGHIKNVLVVIGQVPCKDRFVMGDPISQLSQTIQRLVCLLARQRRAVRERSTKRRPPECHLIVRLAPSRIDATSGAKQRNPEAKGERSHNPRWLLCMAGARYIGFRVGNPNKTPRVEPSRRVVVPSRTVASGELPMHCVPQRDLQTLQWSVERGTDGRVPSVEMKCFLPVSLHGSEVRAHAFWRK